MRKGAVRGVASGFDSEAFSIPAGGKKRDRPLRRLFKTAEGKRDKREKRKKGRGPGAGLGSDRPG
jgi:hypothetical protein